MFLKCVQADAADSALKDPTARRKPIKLKVGLHVGPVVAGFVGKVIPKFCIFGPLLNQVGI
jgi:class 3 adenylate cyclase